MWMLGAELQLGSRFFFLLGQTCPPFCLCSELPYMLKCVPIWHLFWKGRNGSSCTLERGMCSLTSCVGCSGEQFHERPGHTGDTDHPVAPFSL